MGQELLPDVKCVKVEGNPDNESLDDFLRLVDKENDEEVKKHMNAIIGVCKFSGFQMYDKDSGIKTHDFEIIKTPDQVLVFDWDLTLTMIEGFLFKSDHWETYVNGLEKYSGVETNKSMESHVKALFGGSARYDMIKRELEKQNVDNVYILTNNGRQELIRQMAKILMPKLNTDHVNSMHYVEYSFSTSLSPKLSYLKDHFSLEIKN